VVLDAAPEEYQSLLKSEQRRLGTTVTIEDLEAIMHQYWRQTNESDDDEDDDEDKGDDDIALSAFKGKCYNFGYRGHIQ
jgi:hypothetical protein